MLGAVLFHEQSKAFLAWIGGAGAVSGLDAGKVTGFMVDWTAGPQHVDGEGDGDVAAGVPAVRPRDRPDGRPAGGSGSRGRVVADVLRCPAA